jgi:hypothetical protein
MNQSNAHLHSYTQHPTENYFPISRVPLAAFQLLTFACVVWRDVVLLGEWFPTFRRIVVPPSSPSPWRWRHYGPNRHPLTSSHRCLPFPYGNPALLFAPAIFREVQKLQILVINIFHCRPSSPLGPGISTFPSLFCSYAKCELDTMFTLHECVNYKSISWNAQNITACTVVCAEAAASQHLSLFL